MRIITDEEYRCAYKEVYVVINNLDIEVKELIPKKKIEFYKEFMNPNHKFEFDNNKSIKDQNILYPTKCILANLFRDYIATEEDKIEIIKKEKQELSELEKRKREMYDPDNIFANRKRNNNKLNESYSIDDKDDKSLVVQNEKIGIFKRIKNFFKKIFNKSEW